MINIWKLCALSLNTMEELYEIVSVLLYNECYNDVIEVWLIVNLLDSYYRTFYLNTWPSSSVLFCDTMHILAKKVV